jgi:hypothetical protein
MKRILIVLIAFASSTFFAQRHGTGGGRRLQIQDSLSNQKQKVKKFSSSDVAGIFYYDIEEIINKLKLKDETKQGVVSKALTNYNFKIKEISFLNSKKFLDFDLAVNSVMKGNDREASLEMRKKVGEIIGPIKVEIHENEKELNQTLKSILSEKQQKKWLKYQKKMKESLQPKKPDTENRQGSRSNGGGMRRQ